MSSWRRGGLALLALLGLSFGGTASAQLNVLITKGVERPTPMAIVPFGWSGGGPARLRHRGRRVGRPQSSGRFAPIAESDMVRQPTSRRPDQLRGLAAAQSGLHRDRHADRDRARPVHGRVPAVRRAQGRADLGLSFMSGRADLRATAHRISDMIFEKLVGVPGVFSTQIAYVSEERRATASAIADRVGRRWRERAHHRGLAAAAAVAVVVARRPPPRVRVVRGRQRRSSSDAENGHARARLGPQGSEQLAGVFAGRRACSRSRCRTIRATSTSSRSTLDSQMLRAAHDRRGDRHRATWSPDSRSFTSTRTARAVRRSIASAPKPGARAARDVRRRLQRPAARVARRQEGGDRTVANNRTGSAWSTAANGALQILTNGQLDESPSFAPNGAQIIYATRNNGRGVLASVTTDGRIQQEIASVAGDVREPVWGPYPRP